MMVTIADIESFLQEPVLELTEQAAKTIILGPAALADAASGEVAFCSAKARNPYEMLAQTSASLIILDRRVIVDEASLIRAGVRAIIPRDNARLDFSRLVERFFSPPRRSGIHHSAFIAPSANLASDVFIGPMCTIGEDVEIGERTVIHAGVHVYSRTAIGCNVTIHSGAVIGSDGFGYERNEAGELVRFPHVGRVVIEDDVEIGANTCIDRGTLGDTRICLGARIDNLVHIAHNVHVGRHTAVIADAMIGGGTRIGDYAWIAPSACLRDGIVVGDRSTVGLAALATRDVGDGETVFGSPARQADEQKALLSHWTSVISQEASDPS